jgi:hypothetical protein
MEAEAKSQKRGMPMVERIRKEDGEAVVEAPTFGSKNWH